MVTLIRQYLNQYKECPIPGVGVLELKESTARIHQGENKISLSGPAIVLNPKERDADPFIQFIAFRNNLPPGEALRQLENYAVEIVSLSPGKEINIDHTGSFYVDDAGRLKFRQIRFPDALTPSLDLVRVIHPNAVHRVRVGDNDTTTAEMSKMLNQMNELRISKWWIGALVLFLIAAAAIALYINHPGFDRNFGNFKSLIPAVQTETYRQVK